MAALSLADERLIRDAFDAARAEWVRRQDDVRMIWTAVATTRRCLIQGRPDLADECLRGLVRDLPRQSRRLARFTRAELVRLRCAIAVARALAEPDLALA